MFREENNRYKDFENNSFKLNRITTITFLFPNCSWSVNRTLLFIDDLGKVFVENVETFSSSFYEIFLFILILPVMEVYTAI